MTQHDLSDCSSPGLLSLVILGDLHGYWGLEDEEYYRALKCDLLLWTGDLANTPSRQLTVARSLVRCGNKSLGLLGNHDGASVLLAWSEANGFRSLEWCLSFGHARRVRRLRESLGEHDIGLARRELPDLGLTLIGMCPLQSGGGRLAFADTVGRVYGITDPEPLLRRHVEESESNCLLLLGHNGPAGVGAEPFAPFGRDWRPEGGDHGDPVFRAVLERAVQLGKAVVLAVGGHMHDRCGERTRQPIRFLTGTPVVNACRVPRLERRGDATWRWDFRAEVSLSAGLQRLERTAWVAGKGIVSRETIYASGSGIRTPA